MVLLLIPKFRLKRIDHSCITKVGLVHVVYHNRLQTCRTQSHSDDARTQFRRTTRDLGPIAKSDPFRTSRDKLAGSRPLQISSSALRIPASDTRYSRS